VLTILSQAGYTVNADKLVDHGLQPAWCKQVVLGLSVNEKVNVNRERRRQIRAEIHNYCVLGPDAIRRGQEGDCAVHARVAGLLGYLKSVNPQGAVRLGEEFRNAKWRQPAKA
jgi:hypothetical protein